MPVAANFGGGNKTVNHTEKEHSRRQVNNNTGELETITTNTAECYFSLLKRGIIG